MLTQRVAERMQLAQFVVAEQLAADLDAIGTGRFNQRQQRCAAQFCHLVRAVGGRDHNISAFDIFPPACLAVLPAAPLCAGQHVNVL